MTTKPTTTATEGERQKSRFFFHKTTNLLVHHAILYISLPSLHPCDMKFPNFTRWLYGVGEHNTMQDLSSSWAKSLLVVQRRSLKDMGQIWLVEQGLQVKTTSSAAPFHMRKFSGGGGWRIVMDTWHFWIAPALKTSERRQRWSNATSLQPSTARLFHSGSPIFFS